MHFETKLLSNKHSTNIISFVIWFSSLHELRFFAVEQAKFLFASVPLLFLSAERNDLGEANHCLTEDNAMVDCKYMAADASFSSELMLEQFSDIFFF